MIVAVTIGHGQAIVKEGDVELASFEDARDLLVIFSRMGVVARLRMSPGARQVRAVLRLQEADHHHLPRHISSPEICEQSSGGGQSSTINGAQPPDPSLGGQVVFPAMRTTCAIKTVESLDSGQVIPPKRWASLAQLPDGRVIITCKMAPYSLELNHECSGRARDG